jgi:pimeloyl-ACP methyl ester carboxylesterase
MRGVTIQRGGRRFSRACAPAVLLAIAMGCTAAPSAARAASIAAPPPATLKLGTQTLQRCGLSPLSYCGWLSLPLDHLTPSGPRISVAYRWYPASAPPPGGAQGTAVPVEGGPGYPSIGSVAGGYSVMYGALLQRWNMLAVDNRGTGDSTPLSCPDLQGFSGPTDSEAFQRTAGECGAALNHRWRYPNHEWVHASDMFTSAPAAEDLAAVIEALGLGKVDLYGDSYGSFFAQVFASRFPQLLRSVILDSTYETSGLDPWYRSSAAAMPGNFNAVCARSPACLSAAPGSSWARITALAEKLRSGPVSAVVPGPDGTMQKVTVNVVGLVDLLNDAAGDPQIYRELDASARALLENADAAPLARLYAQRLVEDEAYFGVPVHEYSVDLYLAVSCLDYPQLFDMSVTPAVRAEQLVSAEAGLPASTFAPFTTAEWLAQDQNTEAYTACLDWPAPTAAQPPTTGSLPLLPSSLPVLVLGGELDTWTPPGDAPKVLAELGGHSRFVELANATHVVGEGDTVCGSELIQRFVSEPQAIDSLDTSCAQAVPPIHTVGVYPSTLAQEPPIEPAPGSGASASALQLAGAAVTTAGDAVARYRATELKLDHGLSGGTVTASQGGTLLTLAHDQLIPGVSVSGTLRLSEAATPADGQTVLATLTARAPGLKQGSFSASWTTTGPEPARLLGTVGAEVVSGSLPAP